MTRTVPHGDIPDLRDRACRDEDPELFFATDLIGIKHAKTVCHRCPVIRDCLSWALTHREYGIWAGTTETERADLLTRHGRTTA